MLRLSLRRLLSSLAIASIVSAGGGAASGCAGYASRTLLDRGAASVALGDLDVAIAIRDATAYFDEHPLRRSFFARERPALPASVVAEVSLGNATSRRLMTHFDRLDFEAIATDGSAEMMTVFDPGRELGPREIEIETSGRELLRIDGTTEVASLRAIIVHLARFGAREGGEDARVCFVRGGGDVDGAWKACPCGEVVTR